MYILKIQLVIFLTQSCNLLILISVYDTTIYPFGKTRRLGGHSSLFSFSYALSVILLIVL